MVGCAGNYGICAQCRVVGNVGRVVGYVLSHWVIIISAPNAKIHYWWSPWSKQLKRESTGRDGEFLLWWKLVEEKFHVPRDLPTNWWSPSPSKSRLMNLRLYQHKFVIQKVCNVTFWDPNISPPESRQCPILRHQREGQCDTEMHWVANVCITAQPGKGKEVVGKCLRLATRNSSVSNAKPFFSTKQCKVCVYVCV